MISLNDFQCSPFEKKCDVVTSNATYVTKRLLGDCKIYLYSTTDYFIEVYYSPVYQKVLMINAFTDIQSMLPYAENVSLADLNL